jgi:phosphopantothenoylcysteine decarboxylase/phosphopantothenate--cysteine ligase
MRILITAGGTREYIDPVRFITNASSGRMGYALARAALKAGHKVILVTTTTSLQVPVGAEVISVETAAQMFEAVRKYFHICDCLIMAAAVADYTPYRKSKQKIKKSESDLKIKLKPTVDILEWAGRHKKVKGNNLLRKAGAAKGKSQIVIGFALEDQNLRENAEKKLKEKNLDIVIANRTEAIGTETSAVHIKVCGRPWLEFAETRKAVTAGRIIKLIETISL